MQQQETGSKAIITAIADMNSVTKDIKTKAGEVFNNGTNTVQEMKQLNTLTADIAKKMDEMTGNVGNINQAIQKVHEVAQKNTEAIQQVVQEVDKFQF